MAGKIALEWQAAQINSGTVASIRFSLWVRKHLATIGFEPGPLESDSFTSTEVLTTRLIGACHRVKIILKMRKMKNLHEKETSLQ